MLICKACLKGVHLSCLPPDERVQGIRHGNGYCDTCRPQCATPGGPQEVQELAELRVARPALKYHKSDPLVDGDFVEFLRLLEWDLEAIKVRRYPQPLLRKFTKRALAWRIHPGSDPPEVCPWLEFHSTDSR
jgi:hypothetical protein